MPFLFAFLSSVYLLEVILSLLKKRLCPPEEGAEEAQDFVTQPSAPPRRSGGEEEESTNSHGASAVRRVWEVGAAGASTSDLLNSQTRACSLSGPGRPMLQVPNALLPRRGGRTPRVSSSSHGHGLCQGTPPWVLPHLLTSGPGESTHTPVLLQTHNRSMYEVSLQPRDSCSKVTSRSLRVAALSL